MGIKIPPYTQLTAEQRKIIDVVKKNGNHLILGGPGTGKSVIALYLSQVINSGSANLLTYNKNLSIYLDEGLNSMRQNRTQNFFARTFDSYFGSFISKRNNELRAQLDVNNNYHAIKFDEAINFTKQIDLHNIEGIFIIDEAQDLSDAFHKFIHHICPRVKVFADQNQIITDERIGTSTIEEIVKAYNLNDSDGDILMLSENFRNTRQIIEFSRFFETYSQPMPTPVRIGPKPQLEKLSNRDAMISRIVNIIDNNVDRTIGIFVPYYNNPDIWKIEQEIKVEFSKKAVDSSRISSSFGEKKDIEFNDNHVHIMTFNTNKGLEYDIVIIPEINGDFFIEDTLENKSKMYVSITRARSQLIMLYYGEENKSFVIRIAKTNKNIVDTNF